MTVWEILGEITFVCIFLYFFISLPLRDWFYAGVFGLSVLVLTFIFFSPKPKHSLQIVGALKKIDERDVVFARFDLRKDSPRYTEYYNQHPENKSKDEKIRKLPDILSPLHVKKHPVHYNLASAEFEFLEEQLQHVDGEVHPIQSENSPEENTDTIKNLIRYLGADLCGVCELDQAFVYSHVGRGPGKNMLRPPKFQSSLPGISARWDLRLELILLVAFRTFVKSVKNVLKTVRHRLSPTQIKRKKMV